MFALTETAYIIISLTCTWSLSVEGVLAVGDALVSITCVHMPYGISENTPPMSAVDSLKKTNNMTYKHAN